MNTDIWIREKRFDEFCRKWSVRELAVFGSVLRPDFGPESDVDFIMSFHEGLKPAWPRILDLEEELSSLVGRPVDVIDRKNIEQSENYIKRTHILNSARVIAGSDDSS